MTDPQIKQYLDENNWSVDAQDCLMKVLNTSSQIISEKYNFKKGMMTIITPDNKFIFKWNLGKPEEE
ncbi:hypothetical protein [Roseburia sp. 1XD42-69]|uniref:hypothetical protein n=1 Tax=Roseburia sp. 1XD42-69 TaxID=2320088 RepID=UPI000EA31ED9|nr:hypothetical protein [Roseburia sp. 1XD42-69]RKJ68902.1 hypothetical protein D7Y06_01235 [Roseburia sp. 1XD42-69]